MLDFGGIYYGAQTAIHRHDPYDAPTVLQEFKTEGGRFPVKDPAIAKIAFIVVTVGVNLPTALLLAVPFTILSWGMAQLLWIALTATALVIAAYLMWSLAGDTAPVLIGWLIGLMLVDCEQLLAVGNVAGIAVSFCAIATCCFVKERYAAAGVLLLAVSLALKPHDSGFVWLYFLLAGGVMRKRALQTLAVTAIIGAFAAMWIAPSSPHWIGELHRNHAIVSQIGGTSDPAISGITSGKVGSILDLQAALSVFLKNPRTYNLAAYLVVGPLIAIWAFVVLRRRAAAEETWLAIGAISVLTLLPVYHRPYDAKLLMLTLPACAILWAEGGARRWLSSGFALTAVLLTSDIPLAILIAISKALGVSASLPAEKSVVPLLLPPLALLAMGSYFLWMFLRYIPARAFAADGPLPASANAFFAPYDPERELAELVACVNHAGVNR